MINNTHSISIIIPVYNDPIGIKNTIKSLLNQDYPTGNYEIIAVDNNSTDETAKIIKRYKRVKFLSENIIQSSYATRNKGLKVAKGEIIAFIDAECVATKDWLKEGIKQFRNPDVMAVAGRIKFTFKSDVPNIYEYLDSARKLNQKEYVKCGFGATANMFVRKKVFKRLGIFNSNLISGGDYEFGQRITKKGCKLIYAKDAVVFHPARSSLKALIKKTIRIAKGQKDLEIMGILKHGNLTLKSFIPAIHIPRNQYYRHYNFWYKIKMLLVMNIVKYRNQIERLK